MSDSDAFAEAASEVAVLLRPLAIDAEHVRQKLQLVADEIRKLDIDPAQQRARRKSRLKLYRAKIAALQKCVSVLEQAAPSPLWDLEKLLSSDIGELISNEAFRQIGFSIHASSGGRYFESYQRDRNPAAIMAADFAAQARRQRTEFARQHGAEILLLVLHRLQAPIREQLAHERARAPDGRPVDQRRRFVISEMWDLYRELTGETLPKVPPERFRRVCAVTLPLYGVDEQGVDKAADRLFARAYKHWSESKTAART